MCDTSGGKRAHHAAQERMREESRIAGLYAQAERARQAELDRMTAMQNEANQRQQEALKAIADSSKAATRVRMASDAATPIMRTKQKRPGEAVGVASLRINRTPGTNVEMGTSGTNLG
jgi:hypothetical protein